MKELYKNLFTCSPIGFYQANREGRILRANAGMAKILGYENADDLLHYANMKDFYLNPGDRERLFFQYENSGGNINDSIEICWKKKSGEAIWVMHHALTTIDDDGHVLYCEGSIIDITDRKQAEFHLHVQHELGIALSGTSDMVTALELVLEAICDIATVDSGGIYVWNRDENILKLMVHKGLSEHFISNTSIYTADSPNFRLLQMGVTIHRKHEDFNLFNHSLFLAEGIRCLLVVPINIDDQPIASINLASFTALEFSEKTIEVIETIASQVGGAILRINSENELKESKEELQLLFDSLDDIMVIVDKNWLILKMNLAGHTTLGYTETEISGMNILELYAPENRPEAKTILTGMLAGETKSSHLPLMTKQHHAVQVETTALISTIGKNKVIIGRSKILEPNNHSLS